LMSGGSIPLICYRVLRHVERSPLLYSAQCGRFRICCALPIAGIMYSNTIIVVLYMVFTNRNFNGNKLSNVSFSVKLLKLANQHK
jgi:hypothetical protein